MADEAQYEYTAVQVFRGSEAGTIAKWRTDGWELDSRDQGLLRTDLTFRRVKPATLAARARAAFSSLEPKTQRGLLAASGALIVLVISLGAVFGTQGGGDTPTSAASATETGTASSSSAQPSRGAVPAPETTTPADPTTTSPAPQAPKDPAPVSAEDAGTGSRIPKIPAPAPVTPKTQAPAPAPAPQPSAPPVPKPSAFYANCDAVRAAGADPIRTGDPGYSRKLDRDGDGVGCE